MERMSLNNISRHHVWAGMATHDNRGHLTFNNTSMPSQEYRDHAKKIRCKSTNDVLDSRFHMMKEQAKNV